MEGLVHKRSKARIFVQVSEVRLQAQHVQIEGRKEHQAIYFRTARVFDAL